MVTINPGANNNSVTDMLGSLDAVDNFAAQSRTSTAVGDEKGTTLANTKKAIAQALFKQASEDFQLLVSNLKESRGFVKSAT